MECFPPLRVALLLCLLLFGPIAAAETTLPFSIAVYRPSGFTLDGPKNISTLHEMGFDAYYFNGDWPYEFTSPGWHDRYFPPWAQACAANNMTFIAGQYYVYGNDVPFAYSTAVDQFGNVEPTTPSPVSSGWWKNVMEAGALHIANLSLYYPIWGIIWDMELYDHKAFKHKYYSFDDEALQGFSDDTGKVVPSLPPGQRRDWLRDHGLLEEFQAWEENRAYELAKGLAEKVHAINPKLVLGFFPLQEVWFHWAILKGFGTEEAPAGAWTGWQTYGGCSRAMAESFISKMEERGIQADFVVGLGGAPISGFEESVRYSKAVWVYTFGPVSPDIQRRVEVMRRYIFFNRTHSEKLPAASLGPDVSARPYRGPGGIVSILLEPYEAGKTLKDNITIRSSRSTSYIGEKNLTEIVLSPDPTLDTSDLPCIIYGVGEDEWVSTEIRYLLSELEDLRTFYEGIGLGKLENLSAALVVARAEMGQDPDAALERLLAARQQSYSEVLRRASQLISNPGNYTIPPSSRTKLWLADLKASKGQVEQGQMYLYDGFRDWYMADERLINFIALVAGLTLCTRLHGKVTRQRA